ncbi:MAG: hypothetical protein MR051_05175 [Lentisphaeria bacterium]|nr:hypothetical protein [Lentisphaeria bacterium]
MPGNFAQSALSVSRMLWEVIGVFCIPSLLFFAYDLRRHWRKPWLYWVIGGILCAWGWRVFFRVGSGRYYSVMILPAMLLIFHFCRSVVPKQKWVSAALLSVVFVFCLGRDLRGYPQHREVIGLLHRVKSDAARYRRPYGVAFPSGGGREAYYTGIPVAGIPYGEREMPEFFRSLKGNLNLYRHSGDVLYLFFFLPRNYPDKENMLRGLMPEGIEILGSTYMDRRHKKQLFAVKYIPREETIDLRGSELLPNGDFSELQSGEQLEKQWRYLGRRAPRFLTEKPQLPRKWDFYQSLTTRSNSLALVEKRGDGNVLRLQADSYLVALTPFFDVKKARIVFFHIKARTQSRLNVKREYRNPGALHQDMFMLRLEQGEEHEYVLKLVDGKGMNIGRIWFWLNSGDIELSNVRIK